MGYTTQFEGIFHLDRPLYDYQALYLLEFARTRRVKRNAALLQAIPDSARESVGLPLGEEGGYFVSQDHEQAESSIVHYNHPPAGQPGLWCQWVPTFDGRGIEWNRQEKFYKYVEWLQYLIDHFLTRWGYQLNGEVSYQEDSVENNNYIRVEMNRIVTPEGAIEKLREAVSPVRVPLSVWQGFKSVEVEGIAHAMSYLSVTDRATALGHRETAEWIDRNILKYGTGTERGFEAEETREIMMLSGFPMGL